MFAFVSSVASVAAIAADDDAESVASDASDYSVDIKNDCSGNVQTWVLSQNDWMTAYVGNHYCITNTTSW